MQPNPQNLMPRTMRSRGDYGLKIAKKGYDTQYATDNQLLYNSSFPVLGIVMYITDDTEWEIVESGSYQWWNEYTGELITRWRHNMRKAHGLGYPPMVLPLAASTRGAPANGLTWNSKYIYSDREFYSQADYNAYVNGGAATGNYVVFNVDISTDVEYPYTDIGIDTEWGQSYDYGIKHLLTSDIKSTDPMDLGLNANIQSILVVATKVATIEEKDKNTYVPSGISVDRLSPFCFIMNNKQRWRAGGVSIQAVSGYRPATPGYREFYTLDGQLFAPKCSLVLVRQPMISADKITASFNM